VDGRLAIEIDTDILLSQKSDASDYQTITPREIDPKVNPAILRNVLLYILARVGAKPNVGETVLYKLLYFIDFDFYEKHGRSITGLSYIRTLMDLPRHEFSAMSFRKCKMPASWK